MKKYITYFLCITLLVFLFTSPIIWDWYENILMKGKMGQGQAMVLFIAMISFATLNFIAIFLSYSESKKN